MTRRCSNMISLTTNLVFSVFRFAKRRFACQFVSGGKTHLLSCTDEIVSICNGERHTHLITPVAVRRVQISCVHARLQGKAESVERTRPCHAESRSCTFNKWWRISARSLSRSHCGSHRVLNAECYAQGFAAGTGTGRFRQTWLGLWCIYACMT